MSQALSTFTVYDWAFWGGILIVQNAAFTMVSRARNSGSVTRHALAAVASNGVWFVSQIFIFSQMYAMITGKYGIGMAIFTGLFYTAFTVIGALTAHYISLKTEKGKNAVGASKKYAQIPKEQWDAVVAKLGINFGPGAY